MEKLGLWQITGNALSKVKESDIEIEELLEKWIEEDPSLVRSGLTVVGRQVVLNGGRLDLLAIDPQGGFVVIEIKRGELKREAVTQAIDYCSSIAELSGEELSNKIDPYLKKKETTLETILKDRFSEEAWNPEERHCSIIVVGTKISEGLERITKFLAGYNVPITSIAFQVFETEDNRKYLAREIFEDEFYLGDTPKRPRITIGQVLEIVEPGNFKESLESIISITQDKGMHIRPWKKSLMFTSPEKKNTTIFTIWVEKRAGKIRLWGDNQLLSDFLFKTDNKMVSIFPNNGLNDYGEIEFSNFADTLRTLFYENK